MLELADPLGVVTSFEDWRGRTVQVPPDAIEEVLTAMGADASGAPGTSTVLPRCVVVRESETRLLRANVPPGRTVEATVDLEDGGSRTVKVGQSPAEAGDMELVLPDDLPLGYYTGR